MLGQILRTSDGGRTWKALPTEGKKWLHAILLREDGTGWIAADDDLMRTEDGGESWKLAGVNGWVSISQLLPVGDTVLAVGQFAVLRYSNGKWSEIPVAQSAS
jgi:photosystem II stability/assembly factor-like uncharacterized protein